MTKKSSGKKMQIKTVNNSKVLLSIIDDYDSKKNALLKEYLNKIQKIKKAGVKKLEAAVDATEKQTVENLLSDL